MIVGFFKTSWRVLLLFLAFLALAWWQDVLVFGVPEGLDGSKALYFYTLQVGLYLLGAGLLIKVLDVFLWGGFVAARLGSPAPKLLKSSSSAVVYVLAVTAILAFVFGQPVTGFFTASGVLAAIIGLALQDVIKDVFSGIAINLDAPFRIGDWIKVHIEEIDDLHPGKVLEINWRTTRVLTEDNNEVVLPNRLLSEKVVTNFARPNDKTRQETTLVLEHEIPLDRARRILQAAAIAATEVEGFVKGSIPEVFISGTDDGGIEYTIRYWFHPWVGLSPGDAKDRINTFAIDYLLKAGLIPMARNEVLVRQWDAELDSLAEPDPRLMLSRVELFEDLSTEAISILASRALLKSFSAEEDLITSGEQGSSMFILVEGILHVFVTINDEDVKVAQLTPGMFFGEMSMLTGEPRSATIRAHTDSSVLEISKDAIDAVFDQEPLVAEQITRVVAARRLKTTMASNAEQSKATQDDVENLTAQLMGKVRRFFGK